MRKRLFAAVIALVLGAFCFAEGYGDILVYTVDSYQESSPRRFQGAIRAESVLCKENELYRGGSPLKRCLVVLSPGYGIDMYEFNIIGDFDKRVVSPSSANYYAYRRLFR